MVEQGVNNSKPCLWMIVPCYNEEEVLPVTMQRIRQLLADMVANGRINAASRAIYVDDCSTDSSWEIIKRAAAIHPVNGGLRVGENCGQQNVMLAGMETAVQTGGVDIVITIDADLQDDLTVVPQMVDLYCEGNDIVYGVRNDRTNDSFLKRTTAWVFYYVLHWLAPFIIRNHSEFRLMSSRVIQRLKFFNGRRLFLRGIVSRMDFPQAKVYYSRQKRQAGRTKYSLWGIMRVALDGFISVYTGKLAESPNNIIRYQIVEKII